MIYELPGGGVKRCICCTDVLYLTEINWCGFCAPNQSCHDGAPCRKKAMRTKKEERVIVDLGIDVVAVPQADGDGTTDSAQQFVAGVAEANAKLRSVEVLVVDPDTGGAKGSKPEDYSQMPPLVLAGVATRAIVERYESEGFEFIGPAPWEDFAAWQATRDSKILIEAILNAARLVGDRVHGTAVEGLNAAARVYVFGSKKYAPGNWLKGYSWRLSEASAWRHLLAFAVQGEWINEESGEPHLAHAIFHFAALHEFQRLELGKDDSLFWEERLGKTAAEAQKKEVA